MQINNLLLAYPIIAIIELYHYDGHIICWNDSLDASGNRHYANSPLEAHTGFMYSADADGRGHFIFI